MSRLRTTREVAHQKMFEAALDSITNNFPPGTLPGVEELGHAYIANSGEFGAAGDDTATDGFELAQTNSAWGFELDTDPVGHASDQQVKPPPVEAANA